MTHLPKTDLPRTHLPSYIATPVYGKDFAAIPKPWTTANDPYTEMTEEQMRNIEQVCDTFPTAINVTMNSMEHKAGLYRIWCGVYIHSAIGIQLLLTRRIRFC